MSVSGGVIYSWDLKSIYVRELLFFKSMKKIFFGVRGVKDVYVLLNFGDSITIDYIFFVGNINKVSVVVKYFIECGV